MSKYILEYCGRAVSFTFSIYPSRGMRVTLSQNNKYYRLDGNMTAEALRYYRSLAPEIRIRKAAPNELTAIPKKAEDPKKATEVKPQEIVNTAEAINTTEIVDTVSLVREETKAAPETETESEFVVNRELPETSDVVTPDMSEQDLCEYLDMNYTEEEARALAEKLGVNVRRLRSKDTVISRLVSEKYQEVLTTAIK